VVNSQTIRFAMGAPMAIPVNGMVTVGTSDAKTIQCTGLEAWERDAKNSSRIKPPSLRLVGEPLFAGTMPF
jgi:hypothetical protein